MKTILDLGTELDTLTAPELETVLARQAQDWYRNLARGVKYLRFGPFTQAIVSSAVSFDGSGNAQNIAAGPRDGYAWCIRRISVSGLTSGATPDVINLYRNQPRGVPLWQLTGNTVAATFGRAEFLLLPGETLAFANSGTIAATGSVTVIGDVVEAAAEELFKII